LIKVPIYVLGRKFVADRKTGAKTNRITIGLDDEELKLLKDKSEAIRVCYKIAGR
jgi:hypothetical protein